MSYLKKFVNNQLKDTHNLLDKIEEEDPELAERVGMEMMLNISKKWQAVKHRNRKQDKLKDIPNLN
ncbi:hypothetical protein SAMN05443144_10295 [Fodinibius roseus]|uniref:Uncharacterized protein n=1 Tax=Fodinibius roseus TaxID=1194090 RepID=A0A1M4UPR1_9BACT|nr:hypothetical protein [Fodinibius roseus]SHE58679.1 hypothetical protein SAMN05443144_10295 [Fodinibius roseus]